MDVVIKYMTGAMSGRSEVRRIDPGQRLWIGRNAKNDIHIPDQLVSGSHASIVSEGGWLVIIDNGSTNGLIMSGQKIDRATIRSGDRFVFGWNGPELEFIYRAEAPAPPGMGAPMPAGTPPHGAYMAPIGFAPPALLPPAPPMPPMGQMPPMGPMGAPMPPMGAQMPPMPQMPGMSQMPMPQMLPIAPAMPPMGLPPAMPSMAPAAPAQSPGFCPQCGRPLYGATFCESCASPRGTARSYPPQPQQPLGRPQTPAPAAPWPAAPPPPAAAPAAPWPAAPPPAAPAAPRPATPPSLSIAVGPLTMPPVAPSPWAGEGKPLPEPLQPRALPGTPPPQGRPPKKPKTPPPQQPRPPAPPPVPLSPADQARRILEKEGFSIREKRAAPFGVLLFRCERALFRQEVLVKVLFRSPEEESADEKRFLREARLAARMHHPNVIKVQDVRAGLDYILIVFECLQGKTIAQEIQTRKERRLPTVKALAIAGSVARALVYVHGLQIVHRNICPDTVMLTEGQEDVKLCDLGLIRIAGGDTEYADATVAGETLGSLGHIAPEQIARASLVDARADIYGLGALLYHAIAGRPPHEASERLGGGKGAAAPPRLETAPPVVADLVAKAMHADPAQRYADASAMLAAIIGAERALSSAGRSVKGAAAAALGDDDDARVPPLESAVPEGSVGSASDGFVGRFKGTQLVELLQMVELHRKSGRIEISGDHDTGTLQFADGRMVGAECGDASGEEGAYRLLGVESGFFRLRFSPVAAKPDAPTISAILFECLRRVDETPGKDAEPPTPAAEPAPPEPAEPTVEAAVEPKAEPTVEPAPPGPTPAEPAHAEAMPGESTTREPAMGESTMILDEAELGGAEKSG